MSTQENNPSEQEKLEVMARSVGIDVMTGWRDDNSTSSYFEAWPEQMLAYRNLVLEEAAAELKLTFASGNLNDAAINAVLALRTSPEAVTA